MDGCFAAARPSARFVSVATRSGVVGWLSKKVGARFSSVSVSMKRYQ